MSQPNPQSQRDGIIDHYASGYEADRLNTGSGQLERERTRELLIRFLPPAPATLLDIGGGPGSHACWLAKQGYEVHLTDIAPLHVDSTWIDIPSWPPLLVGIAAFAGGFYRTFRRSEGPGFTMPRSSDR